MKKFADLFLFSCTVCAIPIFFSCSSGKSEFAMKSSKSTSNKESTDPTELSSKVDLIRSDAEKIGKDLLSTLDGIELDLKGFKYKYDLEVLSKQVNIFKGLCDKCREVIGTAKKFIDINSNSGIKKTDTVFSLLNEAKKKAENLSKCLNEKRIELKEKETQLKNEVKQKEKELKEKEKKEKEKEKVTKDIGKLEAKNETLEKQNQDHEKKIKKNEEEIEKNENEIKELQEKLKNLDT